VAQLVLDDVLPDGRAKAVERDLQNLLLRDLDPLTGLLDLRQEVIDGLPPSLSHLPEVGNSLPGGCWERTKAFPEARRQEGDICLCVLVLGPVPPGRGILEE
jgi:hypothetical protein